MKKSLKGAVWAGLGYALPIVAMAQPVTTIERGFERVFNIINRYIIPLAFALAIVWFLYGVFGYVTAGGDEKKRTDGRNMMIYGIIAIFVMTSVWGLVNLLKNTVGLQQNNAPLDLPVAPTR